jgi:DNA-binding MarR family transcriptional regulator
VTSVHARTSARDILAVVPLVMRTVAAELRAAGELPAPAHFGLLSMLAAQSTALTLTELAARQGVSLPTMSNTVSAMVGRGWVRRAAPATNRRVVRIQVTAKGRATVRRVGRSAEAHLAELLDPLDDAARARLQAGLEVLLRVFARDAGAGEDVRSWQPDARRARRRP